MKKQRINIIVLIVILAISGVIGFIYWRHNKLYPATDDAYVNAHVINIAAQVTGPVIKTYVQNYQLVQQNQPLFDIDPTPYSLAVQKAQAALDLAQQKVAGEQAAVQAATAQLAARQEELVLAQQNAKRILPLVQSNHIAKTEGDKIREQVKVARSAVKEATENLEQAKQTLGATGNSNADIQNAQAVLAQAQLDLQHTHVVAPEAGRLINFSTRVGDMINASVDLFSIIEQTTWWVDSNFKETDLLRIHVGQPATIVVDIYPDHTFKGIVTDISQGSGSAFALLPAENATGNWVKVTQRFSVKVQIQDVDPNYPLRVGASATVKIDTSHLHP